VQRYFHSLTHALRGLQTAVRRERNLRLFLALIAAVAFLSFSLRIQDWEWAILLLSGGAFLGVELLNTALERFTDLFDEHVKGSEFERSHFSHIKAVKDVASAAALVAGLTAAVVTTIILYPYVLSLLTS
jgi:diacylglycerol kinase